MASHTQDDNLAVADEIGRMFDDLKEYVLRNPDRISPMLPGGMPRSDPPPTERTEHEA